jgi:hypothetical protein
MTPEMLAAVRDFISMVGFPIAVSAFVLLRVDRTLGQVRDAVRDLVKLNGGKRNGDRV